jgi:RES domain-containing protein
LRHGTPALVDASMAKLFATEMANQAAEILPPDWQSEPPPPSTKALGDAWVQELRSAVLQLPSVIIPGESNYLLNPAHPDFKRISIANPEPFAFDPRLLT